MPNQWNFEVGTQQYMFGQLLSADITVHCVEDNSQNHGVSING